MATVDTSRTPALEPTARLGGENAAAATQTYLYLRTGLVGAVIAIGLAVALTPAALLPKGQGALSSISHYYYTPAKIVFVGALCAASLALLALAGVGIQSYILDIAALLAPLIALIPTPVRLAQIEAFDPKCGRPDDACIPPGDFGDMRLGFEVWLWIAGLAIAFGIVQSVRRAVLARRHPRQPRPVPPLHWATLLVAASVWAVLLVTGFLAQPWFHASAHFLIAGAFFVLVATVVWIEAVRQWRPRSTILGDAEDKDHGSQALAIAYAIIAVALALDIAAAVVVIVRQKWFDPAFAPTGVFLVEAIGLACFAVFFALQAWEHRHDVDGWRPLPPNRAKLEHIRRGVGS